MAIETAAIYCRLSQDDGSVGESGSIQTQKTLLTQYCKEHHIKVGDCYCDESIILGLGQEVLVPQGFPGLVLIFMRLRICGPSGRMIEKCVELAGLL